MSLEFKNGSSEPPTRKYRGIFSWWHKDRPEFAHPWSAYRPETYLAGLPPQGVVIATKAHLLCLSPITPAADDCYATAISIAAPVVMATATAVDAPPVRAAPIPLAPALLLLAAPATEVSNREAEPFGQLVLPLEPTEPVVLKLVRIEPAPKAPTVPAPLLPKSSGQDFQLAARLKSVAVLNRSMETLATAAVRQAALAHLRGKRRGNIIASAPARPARRTRIIEPPAVLRKSRASAEVIHLKRALTRAEHAKSRNIA